MPRRSRDVTALVECARHDPAFGADSGSGFSAYVPVGSLATGKALVTAAGRGRAACTTCHGDDLKGLGGACYSSAVSSASMSRASL
jgi:hypothetical protein